MQYIDGICMYLTFTLVQDKGAEVILRNLLVALIEPFTINDEVIHTKFNGRIAIFKLVFPKQQSMFSSLQKRFSPNLHINLVLTFLRQK